MQHKSGNKGKGDSWLDYVIPYYIVHVHYTCIYTLAVYCKCIILYCSQKELKRKQAECDHAKSVEREAERLRRKMSTMEG